MRIERTKNAVRNIVFGVAYRILNIVLPFVSRTIILYTIGEQYLGLSSLFSSILSFLSLAELGMGSAMVYSMYKPIAENDEDTMCALLKLYRKYYTMIGIVIFVLGMMLMPFLRVLVHETLPGDLNIYLLYFLYLINASLSYWMFAYKNALLQAYQRNDINSKISIVLTPLSYLCMLIALLITKNYYAYVIWLPIFTILTNVVRMLYVNKNYPNLVPRGEVSKELKDSITKKVIALIGTKLNTVVLHSADNIVMSAFFGLSTIATYGNYYYIMSSVSSFLGICYPAMTAGLGNSIATESTDKNYEDLKKFSFINAWLVGWCAICLACLYQPFMFIWTKGRLQFPLYITLEFALYFYVYMIRKIPATYKDAAGIWWEDRFRPYVCMFVNLGLNIMLVQIIGVSGIILSTVFSLFISIPWENYTIFKYVFKRSSRQYYGQMSFYLFVTLIAGGITYLACMPLGDGFLPFFFRLWICLIVPNAITYLFLHKSAEYEASKKFVLRIIKRRS